MTDWSKIGRKSRRKGKAFECAVARFLTRHWGPDGWASTRNSGRTDLKGDVYYVKHPGRMHVECKDRRDVTLSGILTAGGDKQLREAVQKAFDDSLSAEVTAVAVFAKVEGKVFVHSNVDVPGRSKEHVTDALGRAWYLVRLG